LREIERQTGFVKTTIKKTLNAGGLVLRNYHNDEKPRSNDPNVMKVGAIPFGYAYLEGQLVKDSKGVQNSPPNPKTLEIRQEMLGHGGCFE
jgi:hypothetical protein